MGKVIDDPRSEGVRPLEWLRVGDLGVLAELFQRHRDDLRTNRLRKGFFRPVNHLALEDSLIAAASQISRPDPSHEAGV
jgi:hypothetical protein